MLVNRWIRFLRHAALTAAMSIVVASAQSPASGGGSESRASASRPTAASRPTSSGFDEMAERLRLASASGAWRNPGWTDPVIESYLKTLVDDAERLTETTGLPRAPGFAALTRRDTSRRLLEGGLFSGDPTKASHLDIPHAAGAVILASGNVTVSHAHGCVVVALGDVDISHGSGNIVVAGGRATIGHDGEKQERRTPKEPLRSLIVAGGAVKISHARRSIVRAGGGLVTSHETEVLELGVAAAAALPESRPSGPLPPGVVPPVPRRTFAADLSGAPPR